MTADIARQKLKLVPAPIQDWFWSDELIDRVLELKDKFRLYDAKWRIVGDLLMRLQIKDLAWEDFKSELTKQLGVTPAEGEKIFDEIKLQLLMPIARDLAAYGIGTKEFAVVAAAAAPPPPRAGSVGPVPLSTSLPAFFSSPAPASSAPQAPAAPRFTPPTASPVPPPAPVTPQPTSASSTPSPIPIFLREESKQEVAHPSFELPVDLNASRGNQLKSAGSTMPLPPRPARVELGKPLPKYDGAMPVPAPARAETPLPRAVDYSAFVPPGADSISVAPADAVQGGDTSFGLKGASNLPPAESVQIPLSSTPLPASAPEENGGFVDSIIRKIAPWHYERFSRGAARASDVLVSPAPSKVVNYTDTVAPAPAKTSAPDTTPAPVPLPDKNGIAGDIPAPPRPLV